MKKIRTFPLLLTVLAAVCALFALAAVLIPGREPAQSALPEMAVYFVDVGQGDCTVVRAGEHVMVIDAGAADMGNRVNGFITAQGAEQPEVLVITHDHDDHIGGLSKLLKEKTFKTVYASSRDTPDMQPLQPLFDAAAQAGTLFVTAENGTSFPLGEARVTLLCADLPDGSANDRSVAVRIDYGEVSFLIAADLEIRGESALIAAGENLDADVLRVGHHGADTSTSSRFLKAVSPDYAVISVGADNAFGHPSESTLTALTAAHCSVWLTRDSGTVMAVTDGKRVTLKEMYERPEGDPAYVGNRKTMKLHFADCPNVKKMNEGNMEFFARREDAVSLGYVPGGCCKP